MTHRVRAVGTEIAYDSVGTGPDVLFLHAGIADRTMWDPQVQAFSGRFRCTTPDARGFADTAVGSVPFSRRDDVAAVMDDIGATTAGLVGCSIGAGFALDLAIERPDRVEALILVGVTPAGLDALPDDLIRQTWTDVDAAIERGDLVTAGELEARAWVDGVGRPPASAPEWLRRRVVDWSLPINAVDDWGTSLQLDPPAIDRLGEVRAPTLVIVGAADAELVHTGCRLAADGIPKAELVVLEQTAHLPNLEVADEFNNVIGAFLDDAIGQ